MMNTTAPSSVLVDVELPARAPVSPTLVRALSSLRVVLLGWFPVPEQTSPEHAQDLFADDARDTIDAVARQFREAGNTELAKRLVFTSDKLDTLSRATTEEACDGVLIPGAMDAMRRVLVPLRGLENLHRIAPFVSDLCQKNSTRVTLLHVVERDGAEAGSRTGLLERAREQMQNHGLDPGRIGLELIPDAHPTETLLDRASGHDLMVLGETKPSVRDIVFGTVPEEIVAATDMPVVVVRCADDAIEAAEKTMEARSS